MSDTISASYSVGSAKGPSFDRVSKAIKHVRDRRRRHLGQNGAAGPFGDRTCPSPIPTEFSTKPSVDLTASTATVSIMLNILPRCRGVEESQPSVYFESRDDEDIDDYLHNLRALVEKRRQTNLTRRCEGVIGRDIIVVDSCNSTLDVVSYKDDAIESVSCAPDHSPCNAVDAMWAATLSGNVVKQREVVRKIRETISTGESESFLHAELDATTLAAIGEYIDTLATLKRLARPEEISDAGEESRSERHNATMDSKLEEMASHCGDFLFLPIDVAMGFFQESLAELGERSIAKLQSSLLDLKVQSTGCGTSTIPSLDSIQQLYACNTASVDDALIKFQAGLRTAKDKALKCAALDEPEDDHVHSVKRDNQHEQKEYEFPSPLSVADAFVCGALGFGPSLVCMDKAQLTCSSLGTVIVPNEPTPNREAWTCHPDDLLINGKESDRLRSELLASIGEYMDNIVRVANGGIGDLNSVQDNAEGGAFKSWKVVPLAAPGPGDAAFFTQGPSGENFDDVRSSAGLSDEALSRIFQVSITLEDGTTSAKEVRVMLKLERSGHARRKESPSRRHKGAEKKRNNRVPQTITLPAEDPPTTSSWTGITSFAKHLADTKSSVKVAETTQRGRRVTFSKNVRFDDGKNGDMIDQTGDNNSICSDESKPELLDEIADRLLSAAEAISQGQCAAGSPSKHSSVAGCMKVNLPENWALILFHQEVFDKGFPCKLK